MSLIPGETLTDTALAVLEAVSASNVTPVAASLLGRRLLMSNPAEYRESLIEAEEVTYHGKPANLRAEAHPEEWAKIQGKPEVLDVFARSLLEFSQIREGIIPERFTKLAKRDGCGAVVVAPGRPTKRVQRPLGNRATGSVASGPELPLVPPTPCWWTLSEGRPRGQGR